LEKLYHVFSDFQPDISLIVHLIVKFLCSNIPLSAPKRLHFHVPVESTDNSRRFRVRLDDAYVLREIYVAELESRDCKWLLRCPCTERGMLIAPNSSSGNGVDMYNTPVFIKTVHCGVGLERLVDYLG
jgi:hypothetical protein